MFPEVNVDEPDDEIRNMARLDIEDFRAACLHKSSEGETEMETMCR